tara:strand:+ start:10753 stop:11673 length:921 start_codon:yes stop_codon:yes gene_type:complete
MIKTDFWTDDKILSLDITTRLFFIGTWNQADDSGILKNSPLELKCKIFPADSITPKKTQDMINLLLDKGLFKLSDDKKLLKIANWTRHQKINRPTPSNYHFTEGIHVGLSEDSLPIERKEKKVKEKEKHHNSKGLNFDDFWDNYLIGRKDGRHEAEQAFNSLTALEKKMAIAAIPIQVKQWTREIKEGSLESKKFVVHGSRWLKRKRFVDFVDKDLQPIKQQQEKEEKVKRYVLEKPKDVATPDEIREELTFLNRKKTPLNQSNNLKKHIDDRNINKINKTSQKTNKGTKSISDLIQENVPGLSNG